MPKTCRHPQKIRVLIVGDGYKVCEQDKFDEKAEEFIDAVKNEEWYRKSLTYNQSDPPGAAVRGGTGTREVGSFFEFRQKNINSEASGVGISEDCEDFYASDVRNAFGSRFCRGRFGERDNDIPFRVLRGDFRKVQMCLYDVEPWDFLLVLANNRDIESYDEDRHRYRGGRSRDGKKYHAQFLRGGYGDVGNKIAWVAANSCDWYSVAMHELGHIMFNLHEEYDYFSEDGDEFDYVYETGVPESNIIPTRRVEILLERLRYSILKRENLHYKTTEDEKDYILNEVEQEKFSTALTSELMPQIPEVADHVPAIFKEIGMNNKESKWFDLVHQSAAEPYSSTSNWYMNIIPPPPVEVKVYNPAYESGLFTYRPVKKGPFKGWYRIRFNIFWKQYGYRSEDKWESGHGYHRAKELKKVIENHPDRIGFYEGAGTFTYGLVRPHWECLMRETKSSYYRCMGERYTAADTATIREEIAEQIKCTYDSTVPDERHDCTRNDATYKNPEFCEVCLEAIKRKVKSYFYSKNSNDAARTSGHHSWY